MKPWLLAQQRQLSKQVNNHVLPHAFIFHGYKNTGKAELALWLTQVVHCQNIQGSSLNSEHNELTACGACKHCQLLASKSHPDACELSTQEKSIGVDDIRGACQFLEKTAQMGGYKTLVISQANKMTVPAANSLLKTLEEPTNKTLIILISQDLSLLLPTIVSRCSVLHCLVPNQALSQNMKCQDIDAFSNVSQLPELTDSEVMAQFKRVENSFIHFLVNGENKNELLTLLTESEHALRWCEKIIVNLMRSQQNWLKNKLSSNVKISHNTEVLWQIHQRYIALNERIKQLPQINYKFEIERFLLEIIHNDLADAI